MRISLTLLLLAVTAAVHGHPQDTPSLLRTATRVAFPRDWAGQTLAWVGPHELLLPVGTGDRWRLAYFDTATGRRRYARALNSALPKLAFDHIRSMEALSGDNKRVMCAEGGFPGPLEGHSITSLDGKVRAVVPVDFLSPIGTPVFGPDPDTCYATDREAGQLVLVAFSVHDGSRLRSAPLRLPAAPADASRPVLLGFAADGRLVFHEPTHQEGPTTIVLQAPGKPATTAQRLVITPPAGQVVMEMELSPDGRRVAYLCSGAPSRDPRHRIDTFTVFVRRLDGQTSEHLIGRVVTEGPWRKTIGRWVSHVRWMPGSTRLSFLYAKGLYTVPVPR